MYVFCRCPALSLLDEARPGGPRRGRGPRRGTRPDPHRGNDAARRDALEHAGDGREGRAEPEHGEPDLAGLCPAATPGDHLQAVQRPALCRKVRDIVGLYLAPSDKALVPADDHFRLSAGAKFGIVSGRWLPSATHWTRPSLVRQQTMVMVAAFSCPT